MEISNEKYKDKIVRIWYDGKTIKGKVANCSDEMVTVVVSKEYVIPKTKITDMKEC